MVAKGQGEPARGVGKRNRRDRRAAAVARVAVPSVVEVEPSMNVTVPVGSKPKESGLATVAVNVTGWP